MRRLTSALALALALVPTSGALSPSARADSVASLGGKLVRLEGEATALERGLQRPKTRPTGDEAERRLVQAQVAYGLGHYEDASLLLYDVVERHPQSRAFREAVFLLAESLFQKGDPITAREYFEKIVREFGESHPRYVKALERLIELSLRLQDSSHVDEWLARLDKATSGGQVDSAPYVRAKYAYFSGDLDAALRLFDRIGKTSNYYFQARYFVGATLVAKGDLAAAVKVYKALLEEPAKTRRQKRIVQLAQLAIGRIQYEREQLDDAIEHYRKIPRTSDLYDDALYELAWAYVKARRFDKALQSLELLVLADPKRADAPDVRILRGNLHIRKARSLVETGAGTGSPAEEYAHALAVFEATRRAYEKPRQELLTILDQRPDPRQFFAQITRQSLSTFDSAIELPAVAVEWVRREPEARRVVSIAADLAQIRRELDDSSQLITRLERVAASASRVTIFPELAERATRARELREEIYRIRQELSEKEHAIVSRYLSGPHRAELDRLQARKAELRKALEGLPNSGDSYALRVKKARARYEDIDKKAHNLEVHLHGLEAELAALEQYHLTGASKMPREEFARAVAEIRAEIDELRKELDRVRADTAIAKDEAGIGDDLALEEARIRAALDQVVQREHALVGGVAAGMSEGDRQAAADLGRLMATCDRVLESLDRTDAKIEAFADEQLRDVKLALAEERTRVAQVQKLLAEYERENVEVGASVLAEAMGAVARKFYEFTVRADLGIVDVAWARKEESKDVVNRLSLDVSREKRVLLEEFREAAEPPEELGAWSEGLEGTDVR